MKRIAYIVPGIGLPKNEILRRERVANEIVGSGARVDVLVSTIGPKSIESRVEESFASTSYLPLINKHSTEYDAFVVGCFGDPGLRAAREITDKPVVGPAESSLHIASLLADRFMIIAPTKTAVKLIEDVVAMYGFREKVVSVRSIDVPVLNIASGEEPFEKIIQNIKNIIDHEKSEAVILGCMSMGFALLDEPLRKNVEVPIINPVKVSLKIAEVLAKLGLSHSPVVYPRLDMLKRRHLLSNSLD